MKSFFAKYKEIILYIVFGALTTLVNYAVYFALTATFLNPENPLCLQAANVISWVCAVVFAYFTNKNYVFKSKTGKPQKQFMAFVLSRLATLLVDVVIMAEGVTLLRFNDKLVKIFSQIAVIVLNYLFSKLLVFKNGGE